MEIQVSDFDHLFASILANRSEPLPRAVQEHLQRPHFPALNESEAEISRLLSLFHNGQYAQCLAALREVDSRVEADPRIRALSGACRALVLGESRKGLEACVSALRRAFYIPDLYCALGMVLMGMGDRAKAHAVYQRGLRIDPKHPALKARLREMGLRRPPVLPFLSRQHQANRFLGLLRARLFRA